MHIELEDLSELIVEEMAKAVVPLHAKIADLEKQLAERPDVAALVADEVSKAVAALPKPQDGKSVTVDDVRPMLDEAIKQLRADADQAIAEPLQQVEAARDALFKAVGDLRQPEDGKSITLDEVRPVIDEAIKGMQDQVTAAVAKVYADTDELRDAAQKAIEAIEIPQDGKSVTVDDVAPMIRAEVEKAVSAIPKPADGVGLAGAMIDRDDCLLVTLTNGEVKNLGCVVGKDGVDGLSLEALDLEYLPDTHEISIKASCAGKAKELRYPAGGIRPGDYWRDGTKAKAGEAWTLDGQMYVAKRDTASRPGYENRDDWVLFVRKGRDGETVVKRVKDGPEPPIKLSKPEGDK